MTKQSKGEGYQRGARGYGKPSKADKEFLESFDRKADKKIYGELAVGMYPRVTDDAVDD